MEKFGFGLVVFGVFLMGYLTFCTGFINTSEPYSTEVLSQYGGMIGGTIGTVFSLAGYFLIYEGLRTNKKTLFENSFFNQISVFNEFRTQQIGCIFKEAGKQPELYKGQDFFEFLFTRLINPNLEKDWNDIKPQRVKQFFESNKSQLSQYLGTLDFLLRQINNMSFSDTEKSSYKEYILNILNDQEQLLIKNFDLVFPSQFISLKDFVSQYSHKIEGPKYETES